MAGTGSHQISSPLISTVGVRQAEGFAVCSISSEISGSGPSGTRADGVVTMSGRHRPGRIRRVQRPRPRSGTAREEPQGQQGHEAGQDEQAAGDQSAASAPAIAHITGLASWLVAFQDRLAEPS
jgi:hypothetical protein